jgi:hypothetical protein
MKSLLAFFLISSSALAQTDLKPLLDRGPVVLLEDNSAGKFGQATAIVYVNKPPEKVFAVICDQGKLKDFMPKVTTSDYVATAGKPNEFDVRMVLDVPGPDTDYTIHFVKDAAKLTAKGSWAKGDLKGSTWLWKVEKAADGNSIISHTLSIKNFSSALAAIEDDSQTMTVGVNVSSALAAVKAIKRRAEAAK